MAKRKSVNWAAIELQYVNSSISYRELAEKHGVKESTIYKHGERHGWVEKRRALSKNVESIVQAKLSTESVDALAEFNRDDLKIAKAIRGLVAANIAAGQRNNTGLPAVEVRALASAAETAQRIGRLALGVATANSTLTGREGGPLEYSDVTPDELTDAVRRVRNEF